MSVIFISHSSADSAAAAEVRSLLVEMGHRGIFLDFDPEDGIPPGRDWESELYRNLRAARAVVFLSSERSAASRWCFAEVTQARALGKPMFTLRLDGARPPSVLTDRQTIDWTGDRDDAVRRLARGLRTAGLDPADSFDWDGDRPPYPGLLAFQEEDAAIFFGRGEEIGETIDLLHRVRRLGGADLVLVLGASGTGKSSLVRAGVLPRLRRDADRWLLLGPFRPRTRPLRELAGALAVAGRESDREADWRSLDRRLRDWTPGEGGENPLLDAIFELRLARGRDGATALLIVDQFEELLGHGPDHPASAFLALLRDAWDRGDPRLLVLATLRSDFLARFQREPGLLGVRSESLSLGPMAAAAVTEVIERPAELAGVEVDPRLSSVLREDSESGAALPLLAFALRELYERHGADGRLELDEYDRLGGLAGSVARAAEDLLADDSPGDRDRELLRAAFLRLARIDPRDDTYVRRPARWSELPPEIRPLLDRFVEARLLTSGEEAGEPVVEVAHEVLFGSWARLRRWLADSKEALRFRDDLHRAAVGWREAGKSDEEVWRGGRLVRARELVAAGDLVLDPVDREFVEAGERVERAQAEAREARRRRTVVWLTAGVVAVSVLAILAGLFGVRARSAERQAEAERERAEEEAVRARSAEGRAEERARQAEIARERALEAQSFGEHQRVLLRARTPDLPSDEARALRAIAPKFLRQAREHGRRARDLEAELDAWRRSSHRLTLEFSSNLFTLEVLPARHGNALLLHYGPAEAPGLALVDGGPTGGWRSGLAARLEELKADRGNPLALDLVVSTQSDDDYQGGLTRMLESLQAEVERGEEPSIEIGGLWTNNLFPGHLELLRPLAGSWRKLRLAASAHELGIPINRPFSRWVTLPAAGAARVELGHGLTATILGPPLDLAGQLAEYTQKEIERGGGMILGDEEPVSLDDFDVVEPFRSDDIELLPSPTEIASIEVPVSDDESVVNLASIVLMLELDDRSIFLPGDSRADVLLPALAQAGYLLDDDQPLEVDVLVLPHHGSDRNVSPEFFQAVHARHYVALGNGRHDNPEPATFEMLFDARRGDGEKLSIVLSYPLAQYSERYPLAELCALFARERERGTDFEVIAPGEAGASVAIDLLRSSDLDGGSTDRACDAPATG